MSNSINPSFNSIAQYAHVGWGYILVTAPTLLLNRFHWHTALYMALLVILGAGIKEYWDAHGLETPDVAGNSWEDFAFWCVGVAGALLALFVAGLA